MIANLPAVWGSALSTDTAEGIMCLYREAQQQWGINPLSVPLHKSLQFTSPTPLAS